MDLYFLIFCKLKEVSQTPKMYSSYCLTVKLFSPAHLLPIIFFISLGFMSVFIANKFLNEKSQRLLGTAFGLIAFLGVFMRMFLIWQSGEFDYKEELPLHLCRVLALAAPFVMYSKNRNLLGVFYFMILAGTLNANITPDIDGDFPSQQYFTYWMIHSSLLVIPIYSIGVYNLRIIWEDVKRTFIYINGYFIVISLFNYFAGSNYFYVCAKPVSKSLLDLFGPWPYYVMVTYFIGLFLLGIFYIPWYFRNRTIRNQSK